MKHYLFIIFVFFICSNQVHGQINAIIYKDYDATFDFYGAHVPIEYQPFSIVHNVCGVIAEQPLRGSGLNVSTGGFPPSAFLSRHFENYDYMQAIDSGNFISFHITVDSLTSFTLEDIRLFHSTSSGYLNLKFFVGKHSEGYVFEPFGIDSYTINNMSASVVTIISNSPEHIDREEVTISNSDTLEIRIVGYHPIDGSLNQTYRLRDSIVVNGNSYFSNVDTMVFIDEDMLMELCYWDYEPTDTILMLKIRGLPDIGVVLNVNSFVDTLLFGIDDSVQYYSFAASVLDTIIDVSIEEAYFINNCHSLNFSNSLHQYWFKKKGLLVLDTTICTNSYFIYMEDTLREEGVYYYNYLSFEGNCDSQVLVKLNIGPVYNVLDSIIICFGDSVLFNGNYYSSSGLFTDSFVTILGCDSIVSLHLTIHSGYDILDSISICFGDSVLFNGNYYSSSGFFADSFVTISGCDSIVSLHLTIHSGYDILDSVSICFGDSVLFNGNYYSSSGIYTDSFLTNWGCDSILSLYLIVHPVYDILDSIIICFGDSVLFNGNYYSSSGLFIDSFVTDSGCDSIVSLHLIIHSGYNILDSISICFGDSVLFNSNYYSFSGIYTESFISSFGCDSTITLVLNQSFPHVALVEFFESCDSFVYQNVTYKETVSVTDTFISELGCDSMVEIFDIVIHKSDITNVEIGICEKDTLYFGYDTIVNAGTYTAQFLNSNGCDSLVLLTVNELKEPVLEVLLLEVHNEICLLDSITLQAKGGVFYEWRNKKEAVIGNDEKVKILVRDPENFLFIRVYDTNGCVAKDSIIISANHCCDMSIPNAFSPNGDGLNDHFSPVNSGSFVEYFLQVFDRFGNRVFVSYNINKGWDGRINDTIASNGVYYFSIMGKCTDGGLLNRKGEVHLIK